MFKKTILINLFISCVTLGFSQWSLNGAKVYYNAGNVGIGTIDPSSYFCVYKSTNSVSYGTYPSIEVNNPIATGTSYSSFILRSGTIPGSGLAGAVGALSSSAIDNASQFLWLRTFSNTYPVRIGYNQSDLNIINGSVGIGTTTPKAYLDIGTATNNVLASILARLPEGGGDGTYLGIRAINTQPINSNSFSLEYRFGGVLNSSINFYRGDSYTGGFITFTTNNGSEKLRIDSDGDMAIGTTDTKGYKLAVNGPAIFTKAVVKTFSSWPDYVFEKDYALIPLDSVENFIAVNKHLPNVPSATEVKKDGIDLGENQAKLLQKIEELTLYLIKQDQKLSEQNDLIANQIKRIEKLETIISQISQN